MKKDQVRIIGGKWRSRKLHFPAIIRELRPTPNRIRETLFNWLGNEIIHAQCLDLFAGSGALGFEALSRGAQSVTFIEASSVLVNYLTQQLHTFKAEEQGQVYQARFPFAAKQVIQSPRQFNLVFLDPPFHKNFINLSIQWLIKENLLRPQCTLYFEAEAALTLLNLPINWNITHCKTTGQVKYGLIKIST